MHRVRSMRWRESLSCSACSSSSRTRALRVVAKAIAEARDSITDARVMMLNRRGMVIPMTMSWLLLGCSSLIEHLRHEHLLRPPSAERREDLLHRSGGVAWRPPIGPALGPRRKAPRELVGPHCRMDALGLLLERLLLLLSHAVAGQRLDEAEAAEPVGHRVHDDAVHPGGEAHVPVPPHHPEGLVVGVEG